MRTITRIFVHCTASWQNTTTVESLKAEFRQKGWKAPGYHWVIFPNGKVEQMLAEDLVANGVKDYNAHSIHVAWVGGIQYREYQDGGVIRQDRTKMVSADNRTKQQKLALFDLLTKLKLKYRSAQIMGHRDISPDLNHNGVVDPWERIKDCPCFDAMVEYMDINKIG
jgi:N-acetyl-anhydromuramyl-L-alanine amidase AmpD